MKLTNKEKKAIADEIALAEARTTGEIRVHLRGRCGEDALAEAARAFRSLGMHRTAERNGVLLFVALDSHRFAVLADEGVYARAGEAFWNALRDRMQARFAEGRRAEAVIEGVREAGAKLAELYPKTAVDRDELPNAVSED